MRTRSASRVRLVDTAAQLFYEHGIHAVGVDRVVAECGVTKPTLYQHFRSKDELVAACLREHTERWRTTVAQPVLERPGASAERVAAVFAIVGRGFEHPRYRGCPFINASAEYPDGGPVAGAIAAQRAEVRALFTHLVADRPAKHRRELVQQLVALYDGALIGGQHGGGAAIARAARRAAVALVGASPS